MKNRERLVIAAWATALVLLLLELLLPEGAWTAPLGGAATALISIICILSLINYFRTPATNGKARLQKRIWAIWLVLGLLLVALTATWRLELVWLVFLYCAASIGLGLLMRRAQ